MCWTESTHPYTLPPPLSSPPLSRTCMLVYKCFLNNLMGFTSKKMAYEIHKVTLLLYSMNLNNFILFFDMRVSKKRGFLRCNILMSEIFAFFQWFRNQQKLWDVLKLQAKFARNGSIVWKAYFIKWLRFVFYASDHVSPFNFLKKRNNHGTLLHISTFPSGGRKRDGYQKSSNASYISVNFIFLLYIESAWKEDVIFLSSTFESTEYNLRFTFFRGLNLFL